MSATFWPSPSYDKNCIFVDNEQKINIFLYSFQICISKVPEWSKCMIWIKNQNKKQNPSNNPKVVVLLCRWISIYIDLCDTNRPKWIYFAKLFIKIHIFPYQNILHLFLFKKNILIADRGLTPPPMYC